MRISDWSSDVCSSDLPTSPHARPSGNNRRPSCCGSGHERIGEAAHRQRPAVDEDEQQQLERQRNDCRRQHHHAQAHQYRRDDEIDDDEGQEDEERSEEHTSELQSLMRISYAVFCLKKKKTEQIQTTKTHNKY